MSDPDDKEDEFELSEAQYDAKVTELSDRLIAVVDDALDDDDFDGGQALTAAMFLSCSTLLMFGDVEDVETFCDFIRKEAIDAIGARERGEFDLDKDDDGVRY